MTYQEHFAAVQERLESDPNLAGRVHDSEVPVDSSGKTLRDNYIVLYSRAPERTQTRLATSQRFARESHEISVQSVGVNAAACRNLAGAAAALLSGWVPSITGRTAFPVFSDSSTDLDFDDEVHPPLAFMEETFIVTSDPA